MTCIQLLLGYSCYKKSIQYLQLTEFSDEDLPGNHHRSFCYPSLHRVQESPFEIVIMTIILGGKKIYSPPLNQMFSVQCGALSRSHGSKHRDVYNAGLCMLWRNHRRCSPPIPGAPPPFHHLPVDVKC